MSNYKFYSGDLALQHDAKNTPGGNGSTFGSGRGKSRYSGGFIRINGRSNNSSAYNHDYYVKNKNKWKRNSQKTVGGFLGDKANNFFSKWRDKAIDTISDFMVDLSMVYLEKMMNDQRLKDLKVDQLVYDTFSPVINRMVNEAVDNAMDRVSKNATKAAQDALNEAKTSKAGEAASNVLDWLNKRR